MEDDEAWERDMETSEVPYRPHEGPCRHFLSPVHYHVVSIVTHEHPREYRAQYGPLPRSGHRMAAVGPCLYLLGGYHFTPNQEGCLFNELWQFNTVSNVWRPLPPLTEQPPVISFAMAAWDGHILQFGGTGVPFGSNIYNTLFLFNTNKERWSQLQLKGQLPGPGYGQSCLVHGDTLLLVGGCQGVEFNLDVHRVCLLTGACEQLYDSHGRNRPRVRYRHEMALYDQKLYILGGGDQSVCLSMAYLDCFCLREGEWLKATSRADATYGYPPPRLCHTATRVGEFVYLHGGDGGGAQGLLGDAWRLHLPSLQWQRLSGADTHNVCFHAAAATEDGSVYLQGGKLGMQARAPRSATMWRLPCQIGSLAALAGEAVLAAAPHLVSQVPISELRKAGLPPSFIARAELYRPPPASPPPTSPAEEGEGGRGG